MGFRLQSGIAFLALAGIVGYGWVERETLQSLLGFSEQRPPLSKVGIIEGKAHIRKGLQMGAEPLGEKRSLFSGDRIETAAQSSVDVQVGTGGLIKILENSRVLFERDENAIPPLTRIEVIEGDVETVIKPPESNIVLVENGTATSLAEHARIPVEKIAPQEESHPASPTPGLQPARAKVDASTTSDGSTAAATPGTDTLPDEAIESTVRNQKSLLSRCFAEHLKTNTKAQGRVDISFLIEKSGTVQQVRIIGSTIPDEKFKGCLVQVIERIQFRKFNSDPILVNYPLSFE